MTNAIFQLKGVSKSYGATRALHRVDLEVPAEKTTVLIGPSGCGKSTLLRTMIGLVQPDEGNALFEGVELTPANVREQRLKMGYVIQEGGLFPHLTARGNASLLAKHLGWETGRIENRIAELAELTQFPTDGLDRYPAQLSGGQRQRVSLMRALMLNPDVLLMDEPLGALDPMIRADLQAELRSIFEELGKSVVMVTHDMHEAGYFGDRVVLMRDGEIAQFSSFEELLANPAADFVTRFFQARGQARGQTQEQLPAFQPESGSGDDPENGPEDNEEAQP